MLKGKVALVTGSTSGIGLGIARRLAAAGADVVLNGFGDAAEIEKLRSGLAREFGVRAAHAAADIGNAAEAAAMVCAAEMQFGRLDILVNNAGIQFVSPVESFPVERWDAVIAINLSGAFYAIRAALPGMKARGYGRIINISSAHGLVASKEKAAYVAAKHGLLGLTKVVALENAQADITCNAICPGWVLTPLVQKQIDARAAKGRISVEQAKRDLVGEKQPNQRFATVEEIAEAVMYLCGPGSRAVTGIALPVDGGWTAQ
ncbi:MAG: 3-hydroxybutyrate dehydrogenase [Betaproteobacteria bacterium]|nr:3-hydroxybutyrate dehydrogenase [Betaproteobacteria bacterium]